MRAEWERKAVASKRLSGAYWGIEIAKRTTRRAYSAAGRHNCYGW